MAFADSLFGLNRSSVNESYNDYDEDLGGIDPRSSADEDLFYVDSLGEGVDPIEYITGVIYECDLNLREMELEILGEEYLYLRENGYEMPIHEGVRGLYEKAREQVEKAWDKIQKFFKDVMKKVEDALRLDSRFLSQYQSKAKDKTIKYKCPDKMWTTGTEDSEKGGGIKKDEKGLLNLWNDVDKFTNRFDKYADAAKTIGNFFNSDSVAEGEEDDHTLDKWKEDLSNILGKTDGAIDIGDMKSQARDSRTAVKDDRTLIVVHGNTAIEAFKNSKKAKDALKKAYDKNKKVVVEQLRALKKLERSQKTGGVIGNDSSKLTHDAVKACQWLLKVMSTHNKLLVKSINLKRKELKKMIVACAAKDKLGGDVEEKKDSESEPKK